jgi:phosphoglycolate phosphatase-like HAD superfamily hydrolase
MAIQTCMIFDVDGTLVDSEAFDNRLYGDAVRDVLGDFDLRSDWSDYAHVTDTGILSEICREQGAPIVTSVLRVRERFGKLVAAYLARGGECPPIAGAIELLGNLQAAEHCVVGIATGGWGHTAAMKLQHAGFELDGIAVASSDHHHTRVGIMRRCRAYLPDAARTVYVGDAEWDQAASAALGWEFIGVGPRLRGRCAQWVADLSVPSLREFIEARG